MRAIPRFLVLLAALLLPRAAFACSCMDPSPACQAFWNVDAVFDATVLGVMPLPRTETV